MPNVRTLRLSRGLTLTELALLVGIPTRTLVEIEYGLRPLVHDSRCRLAQIYDLQPDMLEAGYGDQRDDRRTRLGQVSGTVLAAGIWLTATLVLATTTVAEQRPSAALVPRSSVQTPTARRSFARSRPQASALLPATRDPAPRRGAIQRSLRQSDVEIAEAASPASQSTTSEHGRADARSQAPAEAPTQAPPEAPAPTTMEPSPPPAEAPTQAPPEAPAPTMMEPLPPPTQVPTEAPTLTMMELSPLAEAPAEVQPVPTEVLPPPTEAPAAVPPTPTMVEAPPAPAETPPAPTEAPLDTPATPESNARGSDVAAFAMQFVGAPYAWAGSDPAGFDCSGFTQYVYRHFGLELPRIAADQYSDRYGTILADPDGLQPGDLVFFANTYEPGITHVGIYVGNGDVVQAMAPGIGVAVGNMRENYWAQHYYGALRP
jgi:cell wall-associated NlpC family hydrolase